jgi:hypothetical protein
MPDGLYLYAICKRTQEVRAFESKSIDGSKRVFMFPLGGIAAVVSFVEPRDYQGEEMQRKAKEDLNWIVTHAKRHEAVLEEAMHSGNKMHTIIPMKFGTIFINQETLAQMMKEQEHQFVSLLERLEGKQEWNLSIDADLREINKVALQTTAYKDASEKALKAPKGMDYFEEINAKTLLSQLTEDLLAQRRQQVSKLLEEFGNEYHENQGRTQDLHEALLEAHEKGSAQALQHRHPILDRAYLLSHTSVGEFHKQVQALEKAFPELIVESSGPWPPFNFLS